MHESLLRAIEAELTYYGYAIANGQVVSLDGSTSDSIDLFESRMKMLEDEQIEKLKNAWDMVETHVKALAGGITVHGLRVLQKAMIRLYRKTYNSVINVSPSASHIKKLTQIAADRLSQSTAEQAAVVLSMIETYEYNLKKIGYLKYLIKRHKRFSSQLMPKIASGTGVGMNSSIQGPYSNLDLPTDERVFEWNDINDETYGRQDLKQNQRRYKLGLEDNAPSDTKIGFYWRELRNEPYLMPGGSQEAGYETSYPYRANMWGNP
jgi:hypothetical protein